MAFLLFCRGARFVLWLGPLHQHRRLVGRVGRRLGAWIRMSGKINACHYKYSAFRVFHSASLPRCRMALSAGPSGAGIAFLNS